MNYDAEDLAGCAAPLVMIAFMLSCLAAWATHIIVCVQDETWLLLIAGAVAFPVGIVHGFGRWFGVW